MPQTHGEPRAGSRSLVPKGLSPGEHWLVVPREIPALAPSLLAGVPGTLKLGMWEAWGSLDPDPISAFRSWLFWEGYYTSLGLSFLICKMARVSVMCRVAVK